MTAELVRKNVYPRKFYQTLMTIAFGIKTGCKYENILSLFLYVYIVDWFFMVVFTPSCVVYEERNTVDLAFILELIQYMLVGVFNIMVSTVFLLKSDVIAKTFNYLQYDFIKWSEKKGTDPNKSYDVNLKTIRPTIVLIVSVFSCITLGPFFGAINDLGKLPIDTRSHFVFFWPKVIKIETFATYVIVYTIQIGLSIFLYASNISLNYACLVILSEILNQFEMLIEEIEDAFNYRMEERNFQHRFIDCIRHHQSIIKFLDDFKSYFKWIVLFELVLMQIVFTTLIYGLTRVDSPLGYKVKVIGSFAFNVIPFIFRCHIGEVVLSLHKRLAEHVYEMQWYDMPSKNRKLIVVMFQRTQRDLSLNSAVFSTELASRQLLSKYQIFGDKQKMDQHESQIQCELDNSIDACEETQKNVGNNMNSLNCQQTNTAVADDDEYPVQLSKCCQLPPVPTLQEAPCERTKYCTQNICIPVNSDCDGADLTEYGREYTSKIGTMILNCICVKFNGLQDSCKHPECCRKVGCWDKPFPTCPPALRWKQDFNRNKKQSDGCYIYQ